MNTLNIQLLYRRSKRFPLIIHHFLPDLAPGLTLSGSNYPYLEQIFMVPKRFEPSKFDCILLIRVHHLLDCRPRFLSWMRVRLVIRRLRVRPLPGRQHSSVKIDHDFFFYGHFQPSADSRRAVVRFWRKNVHNTGWRLWGLYLPSKRLVR